MLSEATVMAERPEIEHVVYVSVKIDRDVMPLLKSACARIERQVQEVLSDLANEWASKQLREKPVKRKPPKPRARP